YLRRSSRTTCRSPADRCLTWKEFRPVARGEKSDARRFFLGTRQSNPQGRAIVFETPPLARRRVLLVDLSFVNPVGMALRAVRRIRFHSKQFHRKSGTPRRCVPTIYY